MEKIIPSQTILHNKILEKLSEDRMGTVPIVPGLT